MWSFAVAEGPAMADKPTSLPDAGLFPSLMHTHNDKEHVHR